MGSEPRDYWASEAVRLTEGAVATKADIDEKIELGQSCGPLGIHVCVDFDHFPFSDVHIALWVQLTGTYTSRLMNSMASYRMKTVNWFSLGRKRVFANGREIWLSLKRLTNQMITSGKLSRGHASQWTHATAAIEESNFSHAA